MQNDSLHAIFTMDPVIFELTSDRWPVKTHLFRLYLGVISAPVISGLLSNRHTVGWV